MVKPPAPRLVTLLTTVATIGYVGMWAVTVLVLICVPALKLAAAGPNWVFGLDVPAIVTSPGATVLTRWGAVPLELDKVEGHLRLPIGMLPWWLVAVLWTYTAVAAALILMSLHQLRRIFQRVRDGAPFDIVNALGLRRLGLLVMALALFDGVADFVTRLGVRRGLTDGDIAVRMGLHINLPLVFLALTLVALAEVFRRGAELEHEQSLVV